MFASVWLGGTDYQLINLNCMLINVMVLLRRRCKIKDADVLLDLADEDGKVRGLTDYHPRVNTKLLLKPRATYVPIKIERDDDNLVKPYEPFVTQLKENSEFMATLMAQYKKKELPPPGKREKSTDRGRNRAMSSASTSGANPSSSATKVKSKKGGTTSRAGKAAR